MTQSDVVIPIRGFSSYGYLILGKTLTLVDPGAPRVVREAFRIVDERWGQDAPAIAGLIATHWHIDHVGGMLKAVRKTKGKIHLSDTIAYHLRDGERLIYPPLSKFPELFRVSKFMKTKMPTVRDYLEMNMVGLPYQPGWVFRGTVESFLKDGDSLPGHPDWVILKTPGHTPDSVCFWHEQTGTLISGDTILAMGVSSFINPFRWNDRKMAESVEFLKKLKVKHLCPGHGHIIKGDDLIGDLYTGY